MHEERGAEQTQQQREQTGFHSGGGHEAFSLDLDLERARHCPRIGTSAETFAIDMPAAQHGKVVVIAMSGTENLARERKKLHADRGLDAIFIHAACADRQWRDIINRFSRCASVSACPLLTG
jgi:hypothetical protein